MNSHHRGQLNGSRSTRWDQAHVRTPSPSPAARQTGPIILSLAAQRSARGTHPARFQAGLPSIASGPILSGADRCGHGSPLRPDARPSPAQPAAVRPLTQVANAPLRVTEPVAATPTDEFEWDDVLTLPRAAVRSRTRLGVAVSRSMLWGNGRRNLAVAGLVACCALTAACGSATRLARPDAPAAALIADRAPAVRDDGTLPTPPLTPGLRAAGRIRSASRVEVPEPQVADPRPDMQAPGDAPSPRTASSTRLVAFRSAPFPYEGLTGEGTPFLNVVQGEQRGHRGRRGQVHWADQTYADNRVLLHVPARFDPSQPGAMVVFFHGYGATLTRDVGDRQQVPQQVEGSGANAVLVAPQFASDARDPSAGHFWEPGGCARFLDEAARSVAEARGIAATAVARLPLVFVPYSGGFYTAALCLKDPAVARRTRGVLMLDAAYGELETYADWAASRPGNLFVSGYTHFTARQNAELRGLMAARGVAIQARLPDAAARGGAVFLPADTPHNDYVTQAWTEGPIRDLLARMPSLHGRDPQAIAAVDLMPTGSIR